MENVAAEHLGIRLSRYAIEHWLRRLFTQDNHKGLFALLRDGRGADLTNKLWGECDRFFKAIHRHCKLSESHSTVRLREPPNIETSLPERLVELHIHLGALTCDNA